MLKLVAPEVGVVADEGPRWDEDGNEVGGAVDFAPARRLPLSRRHQREVKVGIGANDSNVR